MNYNNWGFLGFLIAILSAFLFLVLFWYSYQYFKGAAETSDAAKPLKTVYQILFWVYLVLILLSLIGLFASSVRC